MLGAILSELVDVTDRVFGRLTVLRYVRTQKNGAVWLCRCRCGNLSEVVGSKLRDGNTNSCGCLKRETVSAKNFRHGFAGMPEFNAYTNAKRRCTDPKDKRFADYGGRGIKFKFSDFSRLLGEIGPRPSPDHSLDRINNDGHYEPGNVRWATRSEQQKNTRDKWAKRRAEVLVG